MNQYPLDEEGIQKILGQLTEHHRAQMELIGKFISFLGAALPHVDNEEVWYEEAEELLKSMYRRKLDFDNFRFDQKNGHKQELLSPYEGKQVVPNGTLERMPVISGTPITLKQEAELNTLEQGFGDVMTPEELALHFGESLPKKVKGKKLNKMTLEEIESWERSQDNSNDIYKISARIKNLARSNGEAVLTPVGESLCNVYTHVMKAFYDFANAQSDKEVRIKLIELIRKQEGMPGNFIMAVHQGVKVDKL